MTAHASQYSGIGRIERHRVRCVLVFDCRSHALFRNHASSKARHSRCPHHQYSFAGAIRAAFSDASVEHRRQVCQENLCDEVLDVEASRYGSPEMRRAFSVKDGTSRVAPPRLDSANAGEISHKKGDAEQSASGTAADDKANSVIALLDKQINKLTSAHYDWSAPSPASKHLSAPSNQRCKDPIVNTKNQSAKAKQQHRIQLAAQQRLQRAKDRTRIEIAQLKKQHTKLSNVLRQLAMSETALGVANASEEVSAWLKDGEALKELLEGREDCDEELYIAEREEAERLERDAAAELAEMQAKVSNAGPDDSGGNAVIHPNGTPQRETRCRSCSCTPGRPESSPHRNK